MKDQIKRCPKCNSFVRGKVCLSDTESAIQGAAQGLIKSTVNSFTYGVGGSVLDATGLLRKGGNAIREQITTHTIIEFDCPCGYIWRERIGNKEENILNEILQRQKDEAIQSYQNKISSKLSGVIIWGIVSALFIWYLIANPAYIEVPKHNWWSGEDFMGKDIQWSWIIMCALALIPTGAALGKLFSYIELKENLKQLRSMSLSQFKDSEYRTH